MKKETIIGILLFAVFGTGLLYLVIKGVELISAHPKTSLVIAIAAAAASSRFLATKKDPPNKKPS